MMMKPMTRGLALAGLLAAALVPNWSQAADTTARDLDDNTQRQHSRSASPDAKPAAPTAQRKEGQPASMKDRGAPRATGVRDWAAIDTNQDHLISPKEMETARALAQGERGATSTR